MNEQQDIEQMFGLLQALDLSTHEAVDFEIKQWRTMDYAQKQILLYQHCDGLYRPATEFVIDIDIVDESAAYEYAAKYDLVVLVNDDQRILLQGSTRALIALVQDHYEEPDWVEMISQIE